ncbi:hypothetical protein FMM75_06230 [Lachnospiraceae bacterium MD335]|mgnify:CR=1 FL=1|nr:hypothetical protein [Lachnospiraceae bacterium MD335]
MSTLEKTISMIENLPEADLLKIQDFIKKFFGQHECETADKTVGSTLNLMSKEDFLQDIKTAEKEIADGCYKGAQKVFDELEQRYGF